MKKLSVKDFRRTSAIRDSQALKRNNLALRELGTDQKFQILRASLAMLAYEMKNGLICEPLLYDFTEKKFLITLLNDATAGVGA